jgi:hypothetical protein
MFNALHAVVLSDSIQEFTQYSEIPSIISFWGRCWKVSPTTINRLCDIVMKNQALYLALKNLVLSAELKTTGTPSQSVNLEYWNIGVLNYGV